MSQGSHAGPRRHRANAAACSSLELLPGLCGSLLGFVPKYPPKVLWHSFLEAAESSV